MSTSEQAAAGAFFPTKPPAFFEKACLGGPQAMFTAEQGAAGVFFLFDKQDVFVCRTAGFLSKN